MGFQKVIYLYCDGDSPDCEASNQEAFSGDTGVYSTIADYKRVIKKQGWIFKGRKAYCSVCKNNLGD